MPDHDVEAAVLAQERRALDEWAKGNPVGFVEVDVADATYFDDIGAHQRIDGIDAVRKYMSTLEGNIPPHRYELVNPKVQVLGDAAVLTLRYHPSTHDGEPLPQWKATSVYQKLDEGWRRVHAHWSMVKEG